MTSPVPGAADSSGKNQAQSLTSYMEPHAMNGQLLNSWGAGEAGVTAGRRGGANTQAPRERFPGTSEADT